MKIAILTSGILPVPAVKGGAVENLIDFYLEYNNIHCCHDITVFSIGTSEMSNHPCQDSKVNHYIYIKSHSIIGRIKKNIYHLLHRNEYYHYSIEYFLEKSLKIIKKNNYDLLIVENRPGYSLKLNKITKKKCVLHLHNDFLNTETKQASEILNGYHKILCVSNFIANKVKEINPRANLCYTLHNAIDYQLFYSATPKNREKFNLSNKDFVIVFSGRLTEEKGILQLIQAIKTLAFRNIKLLIIGASSYGKDKYPTHFIQRLEKESLPIKSQIIFTGFIGYRHIPSYIKMADIAVVPSMWEEPFGLTVVEAMAAGLPLITTRSGGIPEICEGVATIVERENIVSNLASAILDLYNHPEKRKAMSEASLNRSMLFDKETYAKDFFKALESI